MRPLFAFTIALVVTALSLGNSFSPFQITCGVAVILILTVTYPPSKRWAREVNGVASIAGVGLVLIHPLASPSPPILQPLSFLRGNVCSVVRTVDGIQKFTVCTSVGRFAVRAKGSTVSSGDLVDVVGSFVSASGPRNVGEFDYAKWCATHHIVGVSKGTSTISGVRAPRFELGCLVQEVRNYVDSVVDVNLPLATAPLASGILLSITDDLPYELQEAFATTGTIHVLSTSGMHLSVLVGAIGVVFFWSGKLLNRALSMGVSMVIGMASGGGPAPMRSVNSLACRVLAFYLQRNPEPWHVTCLAACIALIWDPLVAMDAGAQLSFIAVSGLILSGPLMDPIEAARRIQRRPLVSFLIVVLQAIIISLCVSILTYPVIAYHMHHISLIAPLANLPISLLGEWALLLGGAAIALSWMPLLGGILWASVHGTLLVMIRVTEALSSISTIDYATGLIAGPVAGSLTIIAFSILYALGRHLRRKSQFTEQQYKVPWSILSQV